MNEALESMDNMSRIEIARLIFDAEPYIEPNDPPPTYQDRLSELAREGFREV